jgi:putative transposase
MDGRGRALDNVFIERLWRSVKHEKVYLNEYESVEECHGRIETYLNRYNEKRIHSSLNDLTSAQVYYAGCKKLIASL